MNVQMMSIDAVKPYFRNPRNNDEAVGAVAKSISEYGFNAPLVVDEEMVVIAGHTRLKAAQQLGLHEVPVVVVPLPEDKAREYRIADNKAGEFSDWNVNDLIAELRELGDMKDFFPMLDVAALLADTAGATNYQTPGQEEIKKVKEEIEGRFDKRSEQAQDRYCRVVCPDCGEEFFIDSREAVTVAKRDKTRGR